LSDALRIRLVFKVCVGCSQHHNVQEGTLGALVGEPRPSVKPQQVRCKLGESIKKPCSDLLTSHRRKCDCAWPAWRNGDVSHLDIGDEITTHGECVQHLQSVELL
jgi:hypothetical protein